MDRLWNNRRLMLVAGDALTFLAALGVIFRLREPDGMDSALILAFLPLLCFSILAAYAAGLYDLRLIRNFVALIGGLLGSSVACWVFGTTYFYLLASYIRFSPKITLLLLVIASHAGMLIWRRAVMFATAFTVGDLLILILADDEYRDHLRRSLSRRSGEEFSLADTVSPDVDLVVLDRRWTDRHPQEARRILGAAVGHLIPVVSINEFHESLFGRVAPQHANDLAWALEHVLPRFGSLYFTTKRVLDVAAAAILLVLFAPVLILVGVTIRLVDSESPLYGQVRIGYMGRRFVLWKFRTMRADADRGEPFTAGPVGADPRVTRLGRLLRRNRIDELPQLWNVLRGEMSLVGPRPEWIKEVEVLERAVPTYSLRYLVPPGITGWAQVCFRATSNTEDSFEKHNYDLYYLKHFCLALDFSILLKTIKRVFVSDARVSSGPAMTPLAPATDPDVSLDIAAIVRRN